MNNLRVWIDSEDFDIIPKTETWLKEEQGWQLNVPAYKCNRCDRDAGKRGRNVTFLIREDITTVLFGARPVRLCG